MEITGDILANGENYDGKILQAFSRFIMQDDILLATMTVKECLEFTIDMRSNGTETEKEQELK